MAHERFEELLGDPDIDAILVSTPTSMHFEQASAALVAGKHVMVEKPIATNLERARKLVNLAGDRGRILGVFHNRRWDADFLTVKSAIESGVFGKIINVESRLGQWGSCVGPAAKEYHPNWRNESAFGGGALFDWGSHFVDQIWQLMLPAKPVRVFAQLRQNVWSRDCDDLRGSASISTMEPSGWWRSIRRQRCPCRGGISTERPGRQAVHTAWNLM